MEWEWCIARPDTKLKREVAIKLLPEQFTEDAERLARFEREAQMLARLQHSNIAAIFGIEQSECQHALIMELVEGEDLSERLARGTDSQSTTRFPSRVRSPGDSKRRTRKASSTAT